MEKSDKMARHKLLPHFDCWNSTHTTVSNVKLLTHTFPTKWRRRLQQYNYCGVWSDVIVVPCIFDTNLRFEYINDKIVTNIVDCHLAEHNVW